MGASLEQRQLKASTEGKPIAILVSGAMISMFMKNRNAKIITNVLSAGLALYLWKK